MLSEKIALLNEDSDEFAEGRNLCNAILEPIIREHGPVSIAAGVWFRRLPRQGKVHFPDGPHEWKPDTGAAANIVVHSWVNDGKSPKHFLETLPGKNIENHRAISYKGPEYCCVASRILGNKGTLTGALSEKIGLSCKGTSRSL